MFKLVRTKYVNSSASTEGRGVSRIEFLVKSVLDTFVVPLHFTKNTRTDVTNLVNKSGIQSVILTFLLFASSVTHAQKAMSPQEILEFKTNVKNVAAKTKTISSEFDQFKHMEFLSDDIKTSGKMQFKSPNLVKWSYTKPFQYSVIFKEGKLLINDEGKKSDINIGSNQLFKKLNVLIVKSISGDMFDDVEFTMSFTKTDDITKVTFDSKDAELKKYIKQFVLYFDNHNHTVKEVKMVEPSDDYTHIIFKNRKENQTIKDEVFSN